MKKMFNRILCLVLALIMTLAMTACELRIGKKETDQQSPVGAWKGTVDVSGVFNEKIKNYIGVDPGIDAFEMAYYLTFHEDGTCQLDFDTGAAVDAFVDPLWDRAVEKVAEGIGISASAARELLAAGGITKEALLQWLNLKPNSVKTGVWQMEGDQLILDGDKVTIDFDGDLLTVNLADMFGMDEHNIDMKVTFERQ